MLHAPRPPDVTDGLPARSALGQDGTHDRAGATHEWYVLLFSSLDGVPDYTSHLALHVA